MFARSKQGAVDVIAGNGPLNAPNCESLRKLIDAATAQGQPRLVIDLRQVPFIDSAGLELLLDALDRCHHLGGGCKLAAPNALCLDILNATGVGLQFEIFGDMLEGAGSFAL